MYTPPNIADGDSPAVKSALSKLDAVMNPSSTTIGTTIPSATSTLIAAVDAEPELETGYRVSGRLHIGRAFSVHEKRKPLPPGAIAGIVIGILALMLLGRFLSNKFVKNYAARRNIENGNATEEQKEAWRKEREGNAIRANMIRRNMENADATEEQKKAWRKEREGNGIRAKMIRRNDEILRKRHEQEERVERERLGKARVGELVVIDRMAGMPLDRAERVAAGTVRVGGTDTAALAERRWVLDEQRRAEERERERLREIARAGEAGSFAEARRRAEEAGSVAEAGRRAEEAGSVAEARRRAAMAVEYAPPPPYAPK